jgi:hypothetical protein
MPGTRRINPVFRGNTPQGPNYDDKDEKPLNEQIVDIAKGILSGINGAFYWGNKAGQGVEDFWNAPKNMMQNAKGNTIAPPKLPKEGWQYPRYNPRVGDPSKAEVKAYKDRSKKKY